MYTYLACSSLLNCSSLFYSIPSFYCSVAYCPLTPYYFVRYLLWSWPIALILLWSSLRHYPVPYRSWLYLCFVTARNIALHFLPSVGALAVFLLPLVYLFPICTISYRAYLWQVSSVDLAVHIRLSIRSSFVRCACIFRFLTAPIFYHCKVENGALSHLCALCLPFWPCFFLLYPSTFSCRCSWGTSASPPMLLPHTV